MEIGDNMEKLNILYIHSHDTGRYIQPHGYGVSTPNLQQMAEEGILFRQAFCVSPTCSPSRASLLTGEYPHSNGQFGLVNRGFNLPDTDKHIVAFLKELGYYTALFGFQHVREEPDTIGYDHVDYLNDKADVLLPSVLSFLNSIPEKPFFISVGFTETHREFPELSKKDKPEYCLPPNPLPDTPEIRADMAAYKVSLRVLDDGIGQILRTLEENNLAQDTLVICTTDHGIAFPGMKCTLKDHGTGVFLILRGPGDLGGGKVFDSMVSHIDLFPTICELLGIEPPSRLQGRSLLPLIKEEVDEVSEEIFTEINYHCQYEPTRAVRTKRWKYIKRFITSDKPLLANMDSGASKEFLLEHGLAEREVEQEQLYDLIFDPNEVKNLAYESNMKGVLDEMRGRLKKWMKATDDPLLKGDISLPEGAVVASPEDQEPHEIWEYTIQKDGFV